MMTELDWYAAPGALSNLARFKELTDWLASDPRVVFQVAQGLLGHVSWTDRYGFKPKPAQRRAGPTVSADDLLAQVEKLRKHSVSLALPRSPEEKVLATCREFALLATALFRAKGIPARARCGFALYLAEAGFYEDHWVCEYWNGQLWIAIDPQIDPFQQSIFQNHAKTERNIDPAYKEMLLTFDPMNVTTNHFINGGLAWKMYRKGKEDASKFGIDNPDKFGLKSLYGAWFVRGQLLRDFAALNKVEAAPFLARFYFGQDWRPWRLVSAKDEELSKADIKLLDTIADLCAAPDGRQREVNKLFVAQPDLQPLL